MTEAEPRRTVIDFADPLEASRWEIVNDDVMGGRSTSRFEAIPEGCLFSGAVSLENNGGFASVRSTRRLDLSEPGAIVVLRCRGDGRTYRFRLRMSQGFDVPSYQTDFTTVAGEWTEHAFRTQDFVPMWRGNLVRGAEPLDPRRVEGLGFLIADRRSGAFRLELAALELAADR